MVFTAQNLCTRAIRSPNSVLCYTSSIECGIALDLDTQVAVLDVKLKKLSQEQTVLVTILESSEDAYRTKTSLPMAKDKIDFMIKKAREEAQPTIELLQAIHDAQKALDSKAKEIEETDGRLNALLEAAPQLNDRLSRLEEQQQTQYEQVHTRATHDRWKTLEALCIPEYRPRTVRSCAG